MMIRCKRWPSTPAAPCWLQVVKIKPSVSGRPVTALPSEYLPGHTTRSRRWRLRQMARGCWRAIFRLRSRIGHALGLSEWQNRTRIYRPSECGRGTAFHPSGQWVATGGGEHKEILLWQVHTGQVLTRLAGRRAHHLCCGLFAGWPLSQLGTYRCLYFCQSSGTARTPF